MAYICSDSFLKAFRNFLKLLDIVGIRVSVKKKKSQQPQVRIFNEETIYGGTYV